MLASLLTFLFNTKIYFKKSVKFKFQYSTQYDGNILFLLRYTKSYLVIMNILALT